MNLANPFSIDTRWLFFDVRYKCFECGSNQMIELHHIMGRTSSSALNACPLCKMCHGKVGHTQSEHQRLFLKTLQYLRDISYTLKQEDIEFIITNFQELNSKELQEYLHDKRERI